MNAPLIKRHRNRQLSNPIPLYSDKICDIHKSRGSLFVHIADFFQNHAPEVKKCSVSVVANRGAHSECDRRRIRKETRVSPYRLKLEFLEYTHTLCFVGIASRESNRIQRTFHRYSVKHPAPNHFGNSEPETHPSKMIACRTRQQNGLEGCF